MRHTLPKHRIIALAVAIGLHAGLLLLLYFLFLKPRERALEPIQLVLVDIGDVDGARGGEEPEGSEEDTQIVEPLPDPTPPAPTPKSPPQPALPQRPKPTPAPQPKQTIATQQHEESLKLQKAKAEKEAKQRAEAEQRAKIEQETARIEAERRAKAEQEASRLKAEADARAREEARREEARKTAGNNVANAFGAGRGTSSSHGNSEGAGNQGKPTGVAGGSFDLAGRSIVSNGGRLTPPETSRAIRGRINVRIVVEASGHVSEARVVPQGTNITDEGVRSAALRAARATRFSTQEGAGEQRGLITYHFDIQ